MSDYTELKRLAEAAPEGPWFGPEYAPGTSYVFDVDLGTLLEYQSIDSEKDDCLRYVAAANPVAVLALIAENERLHLDNSSLRGSCARLGAEHAAMSRNFKKANRMQFEARTERDKLRAEVAGLRTGYEAYERVNAELKAEIEKLRKDAERYRWLIRNAEEIYFSGTNLDLAPFHAGHEKIKKIKEGADSDIDAAMRKGEQS